MQRTQTETRRTAALMEAGIVALALPTDFTRIGSTACASCQQLNLLTCPKLRIMAKEDFLKRPHYKRFPLLLYMALCAVAGSAHFRAQCKQRKSNTWRRTYVLDKGELSSPSSTKSWRQMLVINGEKTFWTASKTSNAFAAGMVEKPAASKLRQQTLSEIANLSSPFAIQ